MTKQDLLRRIEALEARIRDLEARPQIAQPVSVPVITPMPPINPVPQYMPIPHFGSSQTGDPAPPWPQTWC